jgi:YfiH family protein
MRLQCVPLAAIALHGWTTRALAIAGGTDRSEAEWRHLADTGGVARESLASVHQVHGASLVDAAELGEGPRPRADGLMTRDASLLLTIRVADCVPLLLADTRLGVVAAVHAGWRGTAAGIAAAAVERLRNTCGIDPADLVAAIGPSIGPCCYTVGEDVRDAFRAGGHGEDSIGRWFRTANRLRLDLWSANRDQLTARGVAKDAVFVSGLCTACHPAWFSSYRREGAAAGRLVGFIRAGAPGKSER